MGVVKWNPEWDALLGTIGDRELARQLGVEDQTVARHRKRLGIPAANPQLKWLEEWDLLLGTQSDGELARALVVHAADEAEAEADNADDEAYEARKEADESKADVTELAKAMEEARQKLEAVQGNFGV